MNGNSLQGAGGIGKAVADWIVEGIPIQELLPFEVNRFVDLHNNRQYLQQRVVEIVERYDAMQCLFNTCAGWSSLAGSTNNSTSILKILSIFIATVLLYLLENFPIL